MKRGLIWAGILVVVVLGSVLVVQHMQKSAVTYAARLRVADVLDGLKPGGKRTVAIDMWHSGIPSESLRMRPEEYAQVVDGMERWLAAKGLTGTISSYTIDDVEFERQREAYQTSVARVACTIDGRSGEMLVAHGEPITWVE
jgi:hypothetical protein